MKYTCTECGGVVDSEDSGQRIQPGEKRGELEHTRTKSGPFGGIMTVGCGPLRKSDE